MQLRDYQENIINLIRNSFRNGHRTPLAILPCGGGKTVLTAFILKNAVEKKNRCLFLVHRKELLDQTINTLNKFNIISENITVGMVKTIANQINNGTLTEKYDLIVFDEAHHSTSSTWKTIIDNQKNAKIIGLTATPCRLDGSSLGDIYDDLVECISTKELINRGFLADYIYYAPELSELGQLKIKGDDYDQNDVEEILDKPAIYGKIIENYKELANNKQTIIYCPTISFSRKISDIFNAHGYSAVHFDGETPKAERDNIIQKFRNKEITILSNVDLISEGFDVPDCHCCILLRPTMSTSLFIQQSTRALRPAENKTAIIIDHVANYLRHGMPSQDREWTLKGKIKQHNPHKPNGELAIRLCKKCKRTFPIADVCPFCNTPYTKTKKEIEMIETVKLIEIKKELELKSQQRKDKMKATYTNKVKEYTNINQCRSRYELKIYCDLHNMTNKQFIKYAFQLGFLKRNK